MGPDRFAREEGDPVPVVRAPVRWGSPIRRLGTGRDATLDTDSGWWLRALFALGTFGFGCIEWETEVRVRVRDQGLKFR